MLAELIKATASIFVIMDALGNIPIFYSMNKGFSKEQRKKNISLSVLIAGIVLLVFLFLGNYILDFFGIRLSSFKVAGGVVLLILGIEITLGLKFKKKSKEIKDLAVVPMGTPLLTGPGVITTVLILVGNYGYWIPLIAAIINLALAFVLLRVSEGFLKIFGKQGAEVISRIMGLMIVAIAVEFIRQGWAVI